MDICGSWDYKASFHPEEQKEFPMHVIELLNTYVYIITNDITFPAVGLGTLQAWLKGVKQNCSSHINDVLNPTTDRITGGGRGHALMSPPNQPHHLWVAKNCCGCYDWAQLCQRKKNKTLRSCASNSKQTVGLWWRRATKHKPHFHLLWSTHNLSSIPSLNCDRSS